MAKRKKRSAKAKPSADLSNRSVLLMLVAVIVVSVFSLGVYLNALDNAQPEVYVGDYGYVAVNLVSDFSYKPEVPTSVVGGKVGVTITAPEVK